MTLTFTIARLYTDLALWAPRSVAPGAESLPELIVGILTLHVTYNGCRQRQLAGGSPAHHDKA